MEWYWKNLTDKAPVIMLTDPPRYPPDAKEAFVAGYKAAKDKYFLELESEANYYQHGHEVQTKGANHAKMKSNDFGVQLWTENSFITGYVTCLKDLFGESAGSSDE